MRAAPGRSLLGLAALAPAILTPAGAGAPSGSGRVLDRFEPIRQPDPTSCGPTCAAMVLRHYGRDEAAAWAELRHLGRRVALMSPRGLGRLLAAQGVAAAVRRGGPADLTAALDGGRPAILLVRIGPAMWHYVVVTGFRDGGAAFLVADPHGRHGWVEAGVLDRSWSFEGDLAGRPIDRPPCTACGGRPPAAGCAGCGGSGRAPDAVRLALEGLGLMPHLLILPDRPPGR